MVIARNNTESAILAQHLHKTTSQQRVELPERDSHGVPAQILRVAQIAHGQRGQHTPRQSIQRTFTHTRSTKKQLAQRKHHANDTYTLAGRLRSRFRTP
jgi:hypothetical protein